MSLLWLYKSSARLLLKRLFKECAQLSTFLWFVLCETLVLPWCLEIANTSQDTPNIQPITVPMHLTEKVAEKVKPGIPEGRCVTCDIRTLFPVEMMMIRTETWFIRSVVILAFSHFPTHRSISIFFIVGVSSESPALIKLTLSWIVSFHYGLTLLGYSIKVFRVNDWAMIKKALWDCVTQYTTVYTQYTTVYTQYTTVHTQNTTVYTQYTTVHTQYTTVYTRYTTVCTRYTTVCTRYTTVCTQYTTVHTQYTTVCENFTVLLPDG